MHGVTYNQSSTSLSRLGVSVCIVYLTATALQRLQKGFAHLRDISENSASSLPVSCLAASGRLTLAHANDDRHIRLVSSTRLRGRRNEL